MKSITLFSLFCFLSFLGNGQNICLNAEESKLYDLIMAYRKEKKLEVIPLSPKLTLVAQIHAKDLAEHFDMQNTEGCNPHSWSDQGDWTPCCYTPDHAQATCMWNKPNEIAGYKSNGYEIAYFSSDGATAQEGLDGWKKSSGHNPLLVNSGIWKEIEWKAIGIGFYQNFGVVWFGELEDSAPLETCN